jgi:ATP-dependent helicase/nuclease subunit B
MQTTVLGPFHPHLEDALVEGIRKYKNRDLLCPLLVVVPSDSLRRHLKKALAAERKLSFLNVQLLTFHQLSLKLFAETHGMDGPVLREGLFFEEALRQLIRTKRPGTGPFLGIEQKAGGCAALWQTLRDLRDGLVDPAVALEALREGHFAQRTSQRTSELLTLLHTVVCFCEETNIKDHSDIDRAATTRVPQSRFLRQFRRIFYYGFYDLTQVQLELFHSIAQWYPTTLFFPSIGGVPPHDGWSFAERFYQRYVQGRGGGDAPQELIDASRGTYPLPVTFGIFDQDAQRHYQPVPNDWRCTLFNTFGIHDEISAVAKEILRLLDSEAVAPADIGVVARSLDAYGATLRQIFDRHQIPIAGAIEEPLVQFPLTKATVLLVNLPAKDYLRSQVIDLLSSPYFNLNPSGRQSFEMRPDSWDLATRELAICKGIKEWERLERFADKDLVLSQGARDQEPRVIPATQLRALLRVVKTIADDLARLPSRASWSQHAAAWRKLLKGYLNLGSDRATARSAADALVSEKVLSSLEQIAALDAVQPKVSLREFCQTFQRWLEGSTIVTTSPTANGVAVMNATAARGLSFRALFIVGMNEGVFPRTIREDAFLRDPDRDVIERDLGYKVSQKLAAFDEEKLLFSLLVNSAKEQLYCSFQRSDEDGRVLAPSWYLAELKRALSHAPIHHLKELTVPRSMTTKAEIEPFNSEELLAPEELAIRLSLAGNEPNSLITAANLSPNLFYAGLKAIQQIEVSAERLNPFDGMVPALDEYWRRFSQHGLSPTALEVYGRCPFQYFAHHVIELEQLERPEESAGPSVAEYGELGHEILKRTYQELIDRRYFTGGASCVDVDAVLRSAAQTAFAEYERDHPIGYPLAWESLRESLTELIRAVIARDLKELSESGYTPVAVETGMADRLSGEWPEPLRSFAVRGRMDRIDVDWTGNRLRVIDYKFKFGASAGSADRDLYKAALRGQRLQPPVYLFLGARWAELHQPTLRGPKVDTAFFYIAPAWSDGPLVPKAFTGEAFATSIGHDIRNTIAELVAGIRAGRFFMQRGPHCQYCEITEICRKNHPPSLWRAEHDPITEPHRRLRDKEPRKP